MADASAIVSVVIAAAQSVAIVYVIGAVGFIAVKFPRQSPLLPASAVSTVARFSFNALVVPLIYSTTARSFSPSTIGDYWFVPVSAFFVMGISYLIPTLLNFIIKIPNPRDFCALRVAATYPNVVALPILIFPSLCENSFVQQGYALDFLSQEDESSSQLEKCVALSNTLVFLYFFSWSLAFWSVGYPQLLAASQMTTTTATVVEPASSISTTDTANTTTIRSSVAGGGPSTQDSNSLRHISSVLTNIKNAIQQTCTSPGFLALLAGFITGCIPPLQSALFDAGGALRFLGSSLETLGQASNSITTIVVAASLVSPSVPPPPPPQLEEQRHHEQSTDVTTIATPPLDYNEGEEQAVDEELEAAEPAEATASAGEREISPVEDIKRRAVIVSSDSPSDPPSSLSNSNNRSDNPIMSDPNYGPYHHTRRRRSSLIMASLGESFRRGSSSAHRLLVPRSTPEMRRLLLWFSLSRLILAPAAVVALIVGLDYYGDVVLSSSVPALAKLVVIVNASVPGALIVVVLLKSQPELADTAAAVAKVYLPTYLVAIVTITAWTALGLWVTLPAPP